MIHVLIHLAGIINFVYGIYIQGWVINIPPSVSKHRNSFGGPWKYLTFINLWIQLAYFVVAIANDFIGTKSTRPGAMGKLQRLRDGLFATLAFPIGLFVGIMFWALFLVNRELIFPIRFEQYISPFDNHVFHTSVLIFQVLELCTAYHVYPSRRSGMKVTAFFCSA